MTGMCEVLKEYTLFMELYEFKVKGRIVKELDTGRFSWEVSHYCKQNKGDSRVHVPSNRTSDVYEDVEAWLLRYLNDFKEIDVKENELY